MKATFEEKEYETAANIELSCGSSSNFVRSSGQVLEAIVGYDTVASVDPNHTIWRVLRTPRPPGVMLLPAYFSSKGTRVVGRIPQSSVNLILQYKRPEYLNSPKSKQWHFWNNEYFRFQVTEHQQKALARLERSIGTRGLVRYACPAFKESSELEIHQIGGNVLANSGFVSPNRLGVHKVWTYQKPGIFGIPNHSGEPQKFESFRQILNETEDIASKSSISISNQNFDILNQMKDGLLESFPKVMESVENWIGNLKFDQVELASDQYESLRNYAFIQSSLRKLKAHWLVVNINEMDKNS